MVMFYRSPAGPQLTKKSEDRNPEKEVLWLANLDKVLHILDLVEKREYQLKLARENY